MNNNAPNEVEAQTDALFNSIGDGVITTDEFGKVTRINPIAQDILGFTEVEMIGEWFPSKIICLNEDGAPLSLIDRPITRAFLTGNPVKDKVFYRKKDGSSVPVAITVSPIILNDRPIGAIEVFRDITVEAEIDRMKSEFISLASHQLRTPLSAIKTYSHMLLEGYMGALTPPQRRAIGTVITSSNRMNELISTLLNITRIETGNITVTPKPIQLHKSIQDVLEELQHSAASKGIDISLKINASAQTITTDSLILKEIITNLLTNAIKYSPANGTITIKVTARARKITISIEDTGFGIPVTAHDKIFTKFYRAPNALQHETTGTGLGLYLVKGLVERLEGEISFQSQENVGTTFLITLPKTISEATKAKI